MTVVERVRCLQTDLGRGRTRWGRARCVAALVLGLSLPCASPALARTETDVGYTREQTFSAALRYLRVDLSYEVTEKDSEAAYLLFNFAAPELQKKNVHGSIEVVQRDAGIRVVINLPELPRYQEEILKQGLLRKLRTEYGEPPAPDKGKRKGPPSRDGRRRSPPPADGEPPADDEAAPEPDN